MLALIVSGLVAAGPGPIKLASVPFQRAGLTAETAALVQETLTNRLAETSWLQVTTQADIAATLGLERQKQLLGCADAASSCAAELAAALGVDGLLTGSLGRVGKSYQLNVRVISAKDAKPLFVYASTPLDSEEALLEEVAKVARLLLDKLEESRPRQAEPAAARAAWPPWVVMGAGVALAGTATAFALLAKGDLDALNEQTAWPTGLTPEAVRQRGETWQIASIALFAAGGAALAGGLLWKLLVPDSPVSASLFVVPGRAGVSVQVGW